MGIERQIPVAEQAAILLHERIVQGVYPPGGRLPSESHLADELGVSRGTIRSALAVLATAGLIVRRQGDGTYVRSGKGAEHSLMHVMWEFTRVIELSGREPGIRVVSLEKRSASTEEAAALGIEPNDPVVSVVRVICADEQPIILSTNIHPASLFTEGVEQLDATIEMRGFLERYCSREIAYGDMDIRATMPDDRVRAALPLGPDAPILLVETVFYDADGRPLVLAINHYGETRSLHDVRRSYPWASIG